MGHAERMKSDKNSNWRGGPRLLKCVVCGKEYRVHKYRALYTNSRFCSRSCASIYCVSHSKTSGTSIERAVEAELKKIGADYQKQVPMPGAKTVVDFMVGNTAIYCDGDYWHSIRDTPARDARQTEALIGMGYSVFRLKEKDIKKDAAQCVRECFTR